MQETRIQHQGQEDPLEKEMKPTLVFLPGKFQGQRSLVAYSPWGCKAVRGDLVTKQQQNLGVFCQNLRKRQGGLNWGVAIYVNLYRGIKQCSLWIN